MVKVTLAVDFSKMHNLTEKIPEIQKKGLNYTSQGMLRHLKINSPVDHGLLRSWYFSKIANSEIEIKTPAEYAPYVNDGTGIYGPTKTPIYSKVVGKPLAFEVNGQMVYTRMIKGQKGQHFVEKSIQQTEEKIAEYYIKAVHEVLS